MTKKLLFLSIVLLVSIMANGQGLTITESGGWLESAYVQWEPVENAESYNVYYSGEGITDHQIDDQLIRSYGSYWRADILGLAAGSYAITVVPVISEQEGEGSTSEVLTVEAHDRSGFAFKNGRVPGAYKADGTPRDNAVVVYITQNTKNTISMDVTGANVNPCVGLQTILEGFKKGDDNRPLIVRFVGQITDLTYMNKGDIVVENDNNPSSFITLEGVGIDAVADGWGIRIKNATNIEIRNLATMNCNSDEGDNIGLQQNNDYIWVHHCDFFYGDAGSDSDQAKGDGALDCKLSTYVTFSYNHFWDSGKSNLLGLSEGTTEGYFITYHHNWYDHSDSRHPRVRYYSAHVYNNYYDGNSKYGVGSTMGSSVFVEGNYFRNCKYPMLTSMQGSDVYDESSGTNDYSDMPTFSKEDGGTIKAYNNYMTGQRRFVPYGSDGYPDSMVDFDAYVATTREEQMSSSIISSYGSNSYNNFDTNSSVMYDYELETPEEARNNVIAYAGRMFGGDFIWTFNNSIDDASYDVNTALKDALTNYQTSLDSIQGDGEDDGGDNGGGGDDPIITGDVVHNFTLSGLSSDFFTISGNLSDSKGTVHYGDLTLIQCLKIESSTSISFNISEGALLTLVFNENFSGNIKIDQDSHAATAGVLTAELSAGAHIITKAEVANLYYMSISYPTAIQMETVSDLQLYPNPVGNVLNIKTDQTVKAISIYSLSGNMINRFDNDIRSINLSALKQGTYIFVISLENHEIQRLIIKE